MITESVPTAFFLPSSVNWADRDSCGQAGNPILDSIQLCGFPNK